MDDVFLGTVKLGLVGCDGRGFHDVQMGSVLLVDMVDDTGVEGRLIDFDTNGIRLDVSKKYEAEKRYIEYERIRGVTVRRSK